tara:strand:+ start:1715 stop:2503 length:789 start_codon:yes stop_codon:yes gene_type:complete
MCIAVYQPKGKKLSKEKFHECFSRNPDGFGLMFAKGGKIHIYKTLDDVERAYSVYSRLHKREARGKNMVLHFRIATHGSVNKKNCHPFRINERLALVHNGVISAVDTHKYKDMSDTRVFAKEILAKLPPFFEWDEPIMRLIEEFIGRSKLIIMDSAGMAHIVNEGMGEWVDGMWFSNSSHCPKKVVTVGGYSLPQKFQLTHTPPESMARAVAAQPKASGICKAEKKSLARASKGKAYKSSPAKNVTSEYKTANYRTQTHKYK